MKIINVKDNLLYYVGGIVRDKLLGKESFDTDIIYVGDAIEYCAKFGEIIQTNDAFKTIRIKLDNGEIVDFASTREEVYERKGHLPTLKRIGCPLSVDAKRRDFTINALYMNTLTGEITDYTGGLDDLKAKKLRILHSKSFEDDPTRIIRALKFRIRFDFELEENTKKLQEKYLQNINYDMSYKRLKKELIETFDLNSQKAFEIFIKEGIYKLISDTEYQIKDINIEELVNKYNAKNIWLVYIGLLPDLTNLELTKEERKIIEDYKKIGELKTDYEIYKAFENVSTETVLLYGINKNLSIATKYLDELKKIKIDITGEDLKTLGIEPSKKYQEIFDAVLKYKLKFPDITKSDEINYINSNYYL